MFELKLENESGNIVDINDGVNYVVIPPVEGLSPPSASLFMSKSPNRKGSKYNGSTLNERNIVITIKILGDIEGNRNALYSWVDTEQYCKVRYKNGLKDVYCEGYVQDCPIDLFTDNEVVSVAIVCPDPYWKELAEIVADISAVLKQFTFPFAIERKETVLRSSPNPDGTPATTTMNKGVPFSTLRENNVSTVLNTGAETGVKIRINCITDVVNLRIYDARDTSKIFSIMTRLPSGCVAVIDTESSPKRCTLIKPDGSTDNLLKYLGSNPTWFTLKKGINQFGYTADEGLSGSEITIGFSNKYAGV